MGLSPSMAYRIWCRFCFLCLFTRKGSPFSSPVYWWDVIGCLFFLSHLWHSASSYPHRPSTDIGGLAICFRHIFCICFFHSFCMPSILIPCARVAGFTIIPYIYAFSFTWAFLESFVLSFPCVKPSAVYIFSLSPSFFFPRHSFVLVCFIAPGGSIESLLSTCTFSTCCVWEGLEEVWSLGFVI